MYQIKVNMRFKYLEVNTVKRKSQMLVKTAVEKVEELDVGTKILRVLGV